MKCTYRFASGLHATGVMILDELRLYVSRGARYELTSYATDKDAAKAFNGILMARFHPREGWKITSKEMGTAVPPPPEELVGYEPPQAPVAPATRIDIGQQHVHQRGDRLIVNADALTPKALDLALAHAAPTVAHLCVYARDAAMTALARLARAPLPHLRTLVVDGFDQPVTRQARCRVGDLAAVLQAHPGLSRLYVIGDFAIAKPVDHPALVQVSVLGNPLRLPVLGRCRAATLKRLQLGLSTEAPPAEGWLADVAALLGELTLDELSLTGDLDATAMLEGLLPHAHSLPRALHVGGFVRDEDTFVEAAVALARAGAAGALAVPEGALADESLAALRQSFAQVTEEGAPFTPGEYEVEEFLRLDAAPA